MTPPNPLPPIVLLTVSTERFTLRNGAVYDAKERGIAKLAACLSQGYEIVSESEPMACGDSYKTRYTLKLREVAAT